MTITRRAVVAGAGAALISGAAPRLAWGQTQADVVVIGAGLAGLNAASILEASGARVIVVEAESRVGGRVHTLDDVPGRPEAGAIQIGQGYRRMEAIAARHGIALIAGGAESRDVAYRINGQTMTARDWAASPANRLSESERMIAPIALAPHFWAKLPVLAKAEDWLTADMAAYDIPYARALSAAGASAGALRLIGANLNGNSIDTLSLLHIMRALAIFRTGAGPTRLIAGGSQRLPEAMAGALRGSLRLRSHVRSIDATRSGVSVRLASGEHIKARHALCTIPFAALRNTALKSDIAAPFRRAIPTLAYTHATFAYIAASEPFWRNDGLPATLWTDETLLGRVFVLGDEPAMLKLFITGRNADIVDQLPDDVAGARMIAAIEAARPSARGKLRLVRRFSWQRSSSARGIYHHIGAGQGAMLAQAVAAEGTTLHFAGEHLARGASGIEGALESGERAARLILARL